MKPITAALIYALASSPCFAEEAAPDELAAKHEEGSVKVADEQDELSADVQQLSSEQTVPKVVELLTEVEDIMDEATDWLAELNTGGDTIAAQTEIIETIHEAAKERQKQSGGSPSGGAMMDMLEKMKQEGQQPGEGEGKEKKEGEGEGEGEGEKGGKGQTGDSDAANGANGGAGQGKDETRRVPKSAGTAGRALPEEFRKALDAYNRGAESR
jgi:hypothetical protein